MRARSTATLTDPTAAARDSLQARFDAGRAWHLGVPERAAAELRDAIRIEAAVPAAVLKTVYADAGESPLLAVNLHDDAAPQRLAELGAESFRRRVRAAAPPRACG